MADESTPGDKKSEGLPGRVPRRPVTPELRQQRHDSRAGATWRGFLDELCRLGSLNEELAERAAVSVLCAVEQRITGEEALDLEAQLPFQLRQLLQRCQRHEGKPPRKFGKGDLLRMVAEDLGLDETEAEPIVHAVILAVRARISEGEAEDVAGQLPEDLAELWRRPS